MKISASESTEKRLPPSRAIGVADGSPITWWRTKRAETFGVSTVMALRQVIAGFAILGSPTWQAAANGNAVAAIRLAFQLSREQASPGAYDLVMTALVACAAEDDAAACLALARMLRKSPDAGRAEARLATSWLVRSFLKTLRDRSNLGAQG